MGRQGSTADTEDKKELRQGNSRATVLTLLICVSVGIAAGLILVRYLIRIYGDLTAEAVLVLYGSLAMCLLGIYLHVILHEAGHLVFGLLTGYRFLSFRIYSITLVKTEGRIKRKKSGIPGTSGQCLMIPPQQQGEHFPYRLYNYGGILMNFLVSLLAILAIPVFPGSAILSRFLLGAFAAAGLMIGIMNGLPVKDFGIANDGYNVRAMKRDRQARESFLRQLNIAAFQTSGTRLKDMPSEWFVLPEGADLTNVMNAYILNLAYNRELDRLDFDAAKEVLNRLKPLHLKLPAGYRNITNLGYMFLALVNGESSESVERYLTKQSRLLIKSARNEINLLRTAYAYYLIYEKDVKASEQAYNRLKVLADRYPVPAEAEMNLMLAEYIRKINRHNDAEAVQN
jgi:hypothetical protein